MKTLQQCKDEVAASYMRVDSFADLKYGVDGGYYDVFDMDNVSDKASELYASQFKREWIPVTDRLPEHSKLVEICYEDYGKQFRCLGYYAPYKTVVADIDGCEDIEDSYFDIDNQKACYYLKPGFYEDVEQFNSEYDYMYAKRKATYWRELDTLPEPPKL